MIPKKYLILLAMIGTLVSLDQLTKFLVVSRFQLGESVTVVKGFFHLTLVHNSGAAFGILANLPTPHREPFFFLVPGITLVVILAVFVRLKDRQNISIYALSLIVGGAVGNLADRIRLGYVIDFLDFHLQQKAHFPAFNLADSAITMGVGLLFVSLVLEKESRRA
jgi:signal peptidase II